VSVIGRAWRCEACHRLWVEQKHPGATHDHVDGIVVCRGQVIEVEVVPYPNHAGAVAAAGEVVEAWDEWQADTAFEDPFTRLKAAVEALRALGGQ
jgi:hypothetical protein